MFKISKQLVPFTNKICLATPTMHKEELKFIAEAFETNWVTTAGKNIDEIESVVAERVGCKYAVALSSGTAALHLAIRLAGVMLYGSPKLSEGALFNKRVFCSDLTFGATVNPVVYEGGIPVFIDSEYDTWNISPKALEKAFEIYPEVKLVVAAHLYGVPGKLNEICSICQKHGAIIIEDAAEAFGASYKGVQAGSFGAYNVISFNGNKIITGSSGGMLLTNSKEAANRVRKWSTQSRELAPWYQHEELGYNYRISNLIAGVVRGQLMHLSEHIAQKKAIYQRYKEGFRGLPIEMNPYDAKNSEPNFWLSCALIHPTAMCRQNRSAAKASYVGESGKSCPTEILETLAEYNAEGRCIWKPMHLQPIYRQNAFITQNGDISAESGCLGVSRDIFNRGFCLPSDNKMSVEVQQQIIEIVRCCFE